MRPILTILLALLASATWGQTNVDLGGITADPGDPVEISADSLSIDRDSGTAIFQGNVLIGQGSLRIAAGRVLVVYDDVSGDITRLSMTGGITLATEDEQAEATSAEYDLDSGDLILTGEVLLTQGQSALSADRMIVNVDDGSARMDGRVRTVFQQDGQ